MSILVTGGAGYIGSHTCIELIKAGYDVVVVDNFYNSKREALKRTADLSGKPVTFYECDIRDEKGLDKIFKEEKIDAVIHFAGLKAVGESCQKPLEYYDNNIAGTLVLCDVMRKNGCKKIVFSSSATVYGSNNVSPLKESMPTGGTTNPYGTTKFMIEIILSDLFKSDKEWSICLLRYFNPIGAHPSALIGELPRGVPNNLVPFITQSAIGKRECLSIFGNDYPTEDGTCLRDYIDVVDLAKAHVAAVSRMLECRMKESYEIFNVGTGRPVSVYELVTAFEKVNGVKLNYKFVDRRPGDVMAIWADTALANEELGWKAERTVEETLASAWAWEKHIAGK